MNSIKALVLDVDGVLTDGGIYLDAEGSEMKRFHSRDGVGIKLALMTGWKVLFCTARESEPVRRRAEELGAAWAMGVKNKSRFLESWMAEHALEWSELAFVGDDLQDMGAMAKCGVSIAVADAPNEVRLNADHTTSKPGGCGAVRDAVEWLLEREGKRDQVVQEFLAAAEGFGLGELRTGGESVE